MDVSVLIWRDIRRSDNGWLVTTEASHRIVALFTLSNDSIKTKLMSFIKDWFRHEDNKTGCRFIVVDAYNEEKVLRYYERNGLIARIHPFCHLVAPPAPPGIHRRSRSVRPD